MGAAPPFELTAPDPAEEDRQRRSAARKKGWADPDVRSRRSAAMKKAWADPKRRAKLSAANEKKWANPEVRARMSAGIKKSKADPDYRARMSAASKKAWADPEVRARIMAGINARRVIDPVTGKRPTRARKRLEDTVVLYGPWCHICESEHGRRAPEARIDMDLRYPDPMSGEADHLQARSNGGTDHPSNFKPSHRRCNGARKAKDLQKARRRAKTRRPFVPPAQQALPLTS